MKPADGPRSSYLTDAQLFQMELPQARAGKRDDERRAMEMLKAAVFGLDPQDVEEEPGTTLAEIVALQRASTLTPPGTLAAQLMRRGKV